MKNVLFVDDEPSILSGLRRSLRSMRKEWNIKMASSGAEALELMDSTSFDVVVSDVRMPEMNGAQFLARVRERQPSAIRVALSGQADVDLAAECVSVCQQFLSKPCETEQLIATIRRLCDLEGLVPVQRLQEILGGMTQLPTLPEIYRDLAAAVEEEGPDIGEISDIVQRDVGIATKILQIANSSFFGFSVDVVDTRQAVTALGIKLIRDLVVAFGVFQPTAVDWPPSFSMAKERERALRVARITNAIAQDEFGAGAEWFVAGLLHGVGRLALAANDRQTFEDIESLKSGELCDRDAELCVLGVGQAEIGAYLLGLWRIPNRIADAVALQDRPSTALDADGDLSLAGVLHVAVRMEKAISDGSEEIAFLDLDYLRSVQRDRSLAHWRSLAMDELELERSAL